MSKSGRDLTAEEKKLWRRVVTRVKPRKPLQAEAELIEPPAAPARARAPSKPAPLSSPKRAAVPPPPANRGGEKRVRRGKIEIGATLDLHGHTQDTGRTALVRFLRSAQRRGDRTVIVITGVGRGGSMGVLKQRLPEWLAEPDLRALVSGFAQTHRAHGGAGACYVFLKRGSE